MGIRIKLREPLSCYCTVNSIKWSHMVCQGCVSCMCVQSDSTNHFLQRNYTLSLATSQFATLIYEVNNLKTNEISDYIFITKLCVGPAHFSKGGNFVVITLCSNPLLELQSHRWLDRSWFWRWACGLDSLFQIILQREIFSRGIGGN